MKKFFRSALYMALYAVLSAFLMNMFLSDLLFTLSRAVLGDLYILLYFPLVLIVTSAIIIAGWRIHAAREEGEEKRTYLKAIEGKEFSAKEVRALRRHDKEHRSVLLAALFVSVIEGLFIPSLIIVGPFQFVLFWIVEDSVYMKHRRMWAEDRMHK